jgi:hypothetical protein
MSNFSSKNYYDVLGVQPHATTEEIVSMYRKLAKKYHADANSSDSELQRWSHKMMLELNEAYNVLKSPEKRREYDQARQGSSSQQNNTYEQQSVYLENWDQVKQIFTDWADQTHSGAPTPELEQMVQKQLRKNINKRPQNYLRVGVPNTFHESQLHGAFENAMADAVEYVHEILIRSHVRRYFLILLAVMTIIFISLYPSFVPFGDRVRVFGRTFGLGYVSYQIFTWIVRIAAHGFKSNLLELRGVLVNGAVALLLLIMFFSAFMA